MKGILTPIQHWLSIHSLWNCNSGTFNHLQSESIPTNFTNLFHLLQFKFMHICPNCALLCWLVICALLCVVLRFVFPRCLAWVYVYYVACANHIYSSPLSERHFGFLVVLLAHHARPCKRTRKEATIRRQRQSWCGRVRKDIRRMEINFCIHTCSGLLPDIKIVSMGWRGVLVSPLSQYSGVSLIQNKTSSPNKLSPANTMTSS